MTYQEALDWLYARQQHGIKLGLENIRALLEALGNPQREFASVHVAGTNGKGSVCAMLEAIFRAAGRRTGLFTSPHLIDFRERMLVDGVVPGETETAEDIAAMREIVERLGLTPTFFEVTTAVAFRQFARRKVDIAVVETGMGGRLDSTNALLPVAAVLTPIAMDHTEWLGDTLAKIAAEKAGIIKPGVPVFSAVQPPEAAAVIQQAAAEKGAPLEFVQPRGEHFETRLYGQHQQENAALAAATVRNIYSEINVKIIINGLKNSFLPCRFQEIGGRYILDGAHNPHAVARLAATWRERFGGRKAVVVFGAMADKAIGAMIEALQPIAREFFFVAVRSPRSADPASLREIAGRGEVHASLEDALREAKMSPDPILVTGSLFLAGESLALLENKHPARRSAQ